MLRQSDVKFELVNPWIGSFAIDYSFYRISDVAVGMFKLGKDWCIGMFYRNPSDDKISYKDNTDQIWYIQKYPTKKEAKKNLLGHFPCGSYTPSLSNIAELHRKRALIRYGH